MKQHVTTGIVLGRTDFGEADRILTVLTPDYGKIRLMARGVRKAKSKLAGGIELFSVSSITYIPGRGEIGTLVSSRLEKHYGLIVQDINRVQLGYELLKLLNRATEDQTEADYFVLLRQSLEALNDAAVPLELIRLWFEARLLDLAGHRPNLQTAVNGSALEAGKNYTFSFDDAAFDHHPAGTFSANHIKSLRLLFEGYHPSSLGRVEGLMHLLPDITPLVRSMLTSYIRT